MLGWLTLLCVQLTVFVVGLGWGWHCHQQRLAKQQQSMDRLRQFTLSLQEQLASYSQQLVQAKLQIQDLQTVRAQPPIFNPVSTPMVESGDYDKIRQLFKQGITPEVVQSSFNLSRSELEILSALQKSAA